MAGNSISVIPGALPCLCAWGNVWGVVHLLGGSKLVSTQSEQILSLFKSMQTCRQRALHLLCQTGPWKSHTATAHSLLRCAPLISSKVTPLISQQEAWGTYILLSFTLLSHGGIYCCFPSDSVFQLSDSPLSFPLCNNPEESPELCPPLPIHELVFEIQCDCIWRWGLKEGSQG